MQVAAVAATAGAVQGSATVSAPAAAETLVGGTSQKQLQQQKQRASKKPGQLLVGEAAGKCHRAQPRACALIPLLC